MPTKEPTTTATAAATITAAAAANVSCKTYDTVRSPFSAKRTPTILKEKNLAPARNMYMDKMNGYYCKGTLRASLCDTLLQTVTELVMPLKEHSLSPRSCPPTRSAPSERFGYW